MLRRIRSRLTYANVMSTVGVFIALGGVSYAAVKLPRNSVGGAQIKKNAVTGSKVRNSSLTGSDVRNSSLTGSDVRNNSLRSTDVRNSSLTGRDVKDGSLTAKDFSGPVQGTAGPKGEPGAAGPAGPAGAAGRSALETLRSGEVVRGAVGEQVNAGAGDEFYVVGSLPIAAPEPLTDDKVVVDGPYEDGADTCKGSFANPTAPPGRLCIYGSLGSAVGSNTDEQEGTAVGGINGRVTPYGFAVRFYSKLAGEASVFATWAYTAP